MKNILVPIDGSRPSHNALQHAIDIVNVYNAELTIVNITNADAVLDSFDVFEDMTDEKVKDLTQLAKDKSGYVLEKAMEAVPENLMVHTVQLVSTPEIGILSEADKCDADLISWAAGAAIPCQNSSWAVPAPTSWPMPNARSSWHTIRKKDRTGASSSRLTARKNH